MAGAEVARSRALAVLRIRGTALAVALLPAAFAVVLLVGGATGRIGAADGGGWTAFRWAVVGCAVLVLLLAAGVAAVLVRARPAQSPTVPVDEEAAPELYRLVRELAERLSVPVPSAIALTPDCDSWLEVPPAPRHRRAEGPRPTAPRPADQEPGSGPAPRPPHPPDGSAAGPGDASPASDPPASNPPASTPPTADTPPAAAPASPSSPETSGRPAPGSAPDAPAPPPSPSSAPSRGGRRGVAAAAHHRLGRVRGALPAHRTGPAGSSAPGRLRRLGRPAEPPAPVLVIGSPFLWWMRVAELRALLAPVVAGTGPSADTDVASARRFVRGLDAAAAIGTSPGRGGAGPAWAAVVRRPASALLGGVARLLLRACRGHAAEMERAVAAWASEHAQAVDYGLRIVAQEQVGLAYAGWDRLLTRVALPAWRIGRWPSRLDAGVVAALTELSRRDRLAEGFESRLGERPACDLLEEPGAVDEAASLLAARLFHGAPGRGGPQWSPVGWEEYPQEVVDRIWRTGAARLHRVLDELAPVPPDDAGATVARILDRLSEGGGEELAARLMAVIAREEREQSAAPAPPALGGSAPGAPHDRGLPPAPPDDLDDAVWAYDGAAQLQPVYRLQPPRTARELLVEHVTAMVCCAAVDTAGARPGLDWLDGPALMFGGVRRSDFAWPVSRLVEAGDAAPLRSWLANAGVRLEKPVRLA